MAYYWGMTHDVPCSFFRWRCCMSLMTLGDLSMLVFNRQRDPLRDRYFGSNTFLFCSHLWGQTTASLKIKFWL